MVGNSLSRYVEGDFIMNRTELSSAFLVGHKDIDREHKELVSILNDMATGYMSKDISLCDENWRLFCDKMEMHNANAEAIMEDLGFPVENHKKSNQNILDNVKNVGKDCKTLADWEKGIFEMRHQFLTQILKHDLHFAEYLITIGYDDSLALSE